MPIFRINFLIVDILDMADVTGFPLHRHHHGFVWETRQARAADITAASTPASDSATAVSSQMVQVCPVGWSKRLRSVCNQ